jgi:Flp pilus assembly protein TadG
MYHRVWSYVKTRSTAPHERGQALPLIVLSMTALLGLAALAIDVGRMTVTRRQLQNAADAAAHAGAQVLPDHPADARNAARTWASRNTITAADGLVINIRSTNAPNDTIEVSVRRNVPYTFARVLGLRTGSITATASATVGSVTGGTGVMPFGLVDLNGPSTPGFGYAYGQEVTLKEAPSNFFGPAITVSWRWTIRAAKPCARPSPTVVRRPCSRLAIRCLPSRVRRPAP